MAMRYHTVVMTGPRMRVFEYVSEGEIEEIVIKMLPIISAYQQSCISRFVKDLHKLQPKFQRTLGRDRVRT